MQHKRREIVAQSYAAADTLAEHCHCLPLSSLQHLSGEDEEKATERLVLAPQEFTIRIRTHLETFFPRITPLSLFLLHISQVEHMTLTPQMATLYPRQCYHAPGSFLEQLMVNIHRAIRSDDQVLLQGNVGAAIIFPHVDQQGIQAILERIYNNVSLLQAETVIPPLKRETKVVMGIGSYPEAGMSIEGLLTQASVAARCFTLRPAITNQLWNVKATQDEEERVPRTSRKRDTEKLARVVPGVPYMQLPTQLPTRLKQLIPHHVALELRCAPVGRDHHCLTVAMADPDNEKAVHNLRELTGLTIFPVACDPSALNALLTARW